MEVINTMGAMEVRASMGVPIVSCMGRKRNGVALNTNNSEINNCYQKTRHAYKEHTIIRYCFENSYWRNVRGGGELNGWAT